MTPDDAATEPSKLWNPDTALAAIRGMFDTAANQIAPGDAEFLPHVLNPLVATFHSQVDRLHNQLADCRNRIQNLSPDEDPEPLQAHATILQQKMDAFVQMTDAAKEAYEHHTGTQWEQPPDTEDPASPASPVAPTPDAIPEANAATAAADVPPPPPPAAPATSPVHPEPPADPTLIPPEEQLHVR